jgi:hypothetical protein
MAYYKLLLLHLQINGKHVTAKLAWLVHTLLNNTVSTADVNIK